MLLEQSQRVARLDVLREHEHTNVRMLAPYLVCGNEALVGVRRRHADVDDRHVRLVRADLAQQVGCIAGLRDDLDARLLEQTSHSFPQEQLVVGDHGPHGRDCTARASGSTT